MTQTPQDRLSKVADELGYPAEVRQFAPAPRRAAALAAAPSPSRTPPPSPAEPPLTEVAELITTEFERVASNIKAMGDELKSSVAAVEKMFDVYRRAIADLDATATAYREEGRRLNDEVTRITKLSEDVSHQAADMKERIKR